MTARFPGLVMPDPNHHARDGDFDRPMAWDLWIERETMQQSDQIEALTAALAKAQAVVKGATKGAENPFFHSKYADLASIWDACREALTQNGLAVVQSPSTAFTGEPETYTYKSRSGEERSGVRVATTVSITTRLTHSSGQWIEGETAAMLPAADPQAVGSAITYLRRYALAAMVGVAPEDDDGEATTRPVPQRERKSQTPARPYGVSETGEFILPGKPTSWGGNGGKAIADKAVPMTALVQLRKWLMDPPDGFDADPSQLITAINEALERRRQPEQLGADDLYEPTARLTLLMKGAPGLFMPQDVEAMDTWLHTPGRTLGEVLQKVEDVSAQVETWRADQEVGKKRTKLPSPA